MSTKIQNKIVRMIVWNVVILIVAWCCTGRAERAATPEQLQQEIQFAREIAGDVQVYLKSRGRDDHAELIGDVNAVLGDLEWALGQK